MEPINASQTFYALPEETLQAAGEAVPAGAAGLNYIYEGQVLNQEDYFSKIRRDFQSFAKEWLLTSSNSSMIAWKGEAVVANLLINKINTLEDFYNQEKRLPIFHNTIDALICYRNMRIVDQFSRTFFARGVSSDNSMKLIIDSEYVTYRKNKITGVVEKKTDDGNAFYRSDLKSVFIGKPVHGTSLWKHSLDTLAHEFGHAFESKANLRYRNDSGALRESFADIMAVMCHHHNERTPFSSAEWKHGVGSYTANPSYSIRTFTTEKGSPWDRGVKHMRDHDSFPNDYDLGAVHDKSGIPSHAFYLVCKAIGGFSYDIPGHIWCNALMDVSHDEDFSTFAGRTVLIAANAYDITIAGIVKQAWLDVGIKESELNKPMKDPD